MYLLFHSCMVHRFILPRTACLYAVEKIKPRLERGEALAFFSFSRHVGWLTLHVVWSETLLTKLSNASSTLVLFVLFVSSKTRSSTAESLAGLTAFTHAPTAW